MDITKFIKLRPILYHLTDKRNIKNLQHNGGMLYSTTELVSMSTLSKEEKVEIIRERRPIHKEITCNGQLVHIRDQRPISIKNLQKCIPMGWSIGDYIQLLNEKVFFWPTLNRLNRHYNRYAHEKPVIIKVDTAILFNLNPQPEFCHLNSGATRSSSYYDGGPPPRGGATFLGASAYPFTQASVAEVTFPKLCSLPKKLQIGSSPNGPWKILSFN
jgi:hypothetical protein